MTFGRNIQNTLEYYLFSVSSLKDEKLIKKANLPAAWKLKHANSILEYFEHLSEMSSKSILTISSNTISKLVGFFSDTV